MHLHDFLKQLHAVLRPKVYLEVGVQYGTSLALAEQADMAIGIDPQPLLGFMPGNLRQNQVIFPVTSDAFYERRDQMFPPVDLAFIDGMHLYEYAMRDYANIERDMAEGGVIVFDDVMPYNQAIAEREQPPGDWTGDVWKVYPILQMRRPDLDLVMVNTAPTGTLLVLNPYRTDPEPWSWDEWVGGDEVPLYILDRTVAVEPDEALRRVKERA